MELSARPQKSDTSLRVIPLVLCQAKLELGGLTPLLNVQSHVMQTKHAWDKLIKLSGNIEEDFKKIVFLLEENAILSEKYLSESEIFMNGKVLRRDYEMFINGHKVQATFETFVDNNQTFLKNAWVITK